MDETKEMKGKVCTCGSCATCTCGWHHGHILFRIILVCIFMLLAFWVGVKLGELKEAFRGSDYGPGYRMMYYGGGYGSPMMPYYQEGTSTASTPNPNPAQ